VTGAAGDPRRSAGGALALLVPGLASLRRGETVRGWTLFSSALLILSTAIYSRDRILTGLGTGDLEVLLATAAMVVGLALVLGVNAREARGLGRSRRRAGQWPVVLEGFRRNRMAVAGAYVVTALYFVALGAPLLAPRDPLVQEDVVATRYLPPGPDHPMGTDKFGRDVLSRVIYGARISLSIGLVAVAIAVGLGTLVGAVAGYVGGRVDSILMRFTDMVLAFPRLFLVLTFVALWERSIWLIIVVLGATGWMPVARLVRGQVLSLKEQEFIQAARALGVPGRRIVSRHLIPHAMAPVIVAATLRLGNTILLEASLSFLGLGVLPPTPSWGNMVLEGKDALLSAWWVSTFPGLVIVLTVVGYNLLGDGLRDALDPRWEG
jgi:peptide/nickel transport system permease protein